VLARTMAELIHGWTALREAETFSAEGALFRGHPAETMPEGVVVPGAAVPHEVATWLLWRLLSKALELPGASMSTSEARRLQRGVEVDVQRAVGIDKRTPTELHPRQGQ